MEKFLNLYLGILLFKDREAFLENVSEELKIDFLRFFGTPIQNFHCPWMFKPNNGQFRFPLSFESGQWFRLDLDEYYLNSKETEVSFLIKIYPDLSTAEPPCLRVSNLIPQ
jgi:hypothetical protein